MFGVTKKNHIEISEIWSFDSIHHIDYANACMSRDRFKLISRTLAFDDINSRETRKNDKLGKFREILDIFDSNNTALLNPGSKLCVDEQLYCYRGRCNFKQYMPSKPAKY
jgi:hypothetical protein